MEDGKKTEDLSGHSWRFFLLRVRGMNNAMKGSLDFGQNGRGQAFEERFRAERVFLLEIEDKG